MKVFLKMQEPSVTSISVTYTLDGLHCLNFFLFIMEFDFRDLVIIIYLFCTLDPRRFFLLRCQHEIWERVGTQAARPIFLSLILTVDAIIGKPLVMPEQIYSL